MFGKYLVIFESGLIENPLQIKVNQEHCMECVSFSYLIKIGGEIPDKIFSSWDINLAAKGRL